MGADKDPALLTSKHPRWQCRCPKPAREHSSVPELSLNHLEARHMGERSAEDADVLDQRRDLEIHLTRIWREGRPSIPAGVAQSGWRARQVGECAGSHTCGENMLMEVLAPPLSMCTATAAAVRFRPGGPQGRGRW